MKQQTPEAQALWELLQRLEQDRIAKEDRKNNEKFTKGMPKPRFDWVKRKPTRYYYPKAWVRSIDDTPRKYESEATKKVQLGPKLKKYLEDKNHSTAPSYTKANIRERLREHDLSIFTAVDFTLNEDFTFTSQRTKFQESDLITKEEKLMLIDSVYAYPTQP